MKILITGGTGTLGRCVSKTLLRRGHTVRVMSTRDRAADADPRMEWVRADLATGAGIESAVQGADAVIHLASSPAAPQKVDVEGTRRLLAAMRTGTPHLLYVSIVGVDEVPVAYYRAKRQAEEIVASSGVRYSVQRATQFHSFLHLLLAKAARVPFVMPLPTVFRFQPIDEREVAEYLADGLNQERCGRLPDLAGPEVLTLGEMARVWLDRTGMRKRILHVPVPGKAANAVRDGRLTAPARPHGSVRWRDWLDRHLTSASAVSGR